MYPPELGDAVGCVTRLFKNRTVTAVRRIPNFYEILGKFIFETRNKRC